MAALSGSAPVKVQMLCSVERVEACVITNFDGSSPLLIKGLVTSEHKYHCMMLAQKCSLNDMVLPDTTRQTNLTTSL